MATEAAIIGAGATLLAPVVNPLIVACQNTNHYSAEYENLISEANGLIKDLEGLIADKMERYDNRVGDMALTRTANRCIEKKDRLKEKVDAIMEECKGAWPIRKAKLAMRAESVNSQLKVIKNEFSLLTEIYYFPLPNYGKSRAEKEFDEYGSANKAIDKILRTLRKDKYQKICMVGTGGIGKSTILDQVGRRVEHENMFDFVISVDLSNESSVEYIQKQIMSGLGKQFSDNYGKERWKEDLAASLSMIKVLIMFDHVWSFLSFEDIGIPYKNQNYKVIIATRNIEFCPGIDKEIQIDFLSEKDSFCLFKKKAKLDELGGKKLEVAKECIGLPLALVVVGESLVRIRKADDATWDPVLRRLKQSSPDSDYVKEKLFERLEMSYDRLTCKDQKLLFLICSLFPKGHKLREDVLTMYGVGMDILETYPNLEVSRDRMHTLVEKLRGFGLLSNTSKETTKVQMHDVVRDVAIWIASKPENYFFIESCSHMDDCKSIKTEKIFDTFEKISIVSGRISELPEEPTSKKVQLLLLGQNSKLTATPVLNDKFFNQMTKLTILDLSDTSISKLPYSVRKLENLRVLLLNRCKKLTKISVCRTWKKLEILSMRGCSITSLPKEIKEIKTLKLLDLSSIKDLTVPPNTLGHISSLEELYLDIASIRDDILIEIANLKKVVGLQLYLKDAGVFSPTSPHFDWSHLKRYLFYSDQSLVQYVTPYKRKLHIKGVGEFADWVKTLFSRTEELVLDNCFPKKPTLQRLVNFDTKKKFEHLKVLRLKKCDGISHLVRSQDGPSTDVFQNLEELYIFGLEDFFGITEGLVSKTSFASIKKIYIKSCKNIIKLISNSLLVRVEQKLEALEVIKCEELTSLFELQVTYPPMFSKLKVLKLYNLPKVTTIYKEVAPEGSFERLKEIDIQGCHILEYLFLSSICRGMKCLEKLVVANNRSMKNIIQHDEPLNEDTFPKLTELEITDMAELTHFYHEEESVMSFSWPILQRVKLGSCPKLKSLPICTDSAPMLMNKIGLREDNDSTWFDKLKEGTQLEHYIIDDSE